MEFLPLRQSGSLAQSSVCHRFKFRQVVLFQPLLVSESFCQQFHGLAILIRPVLQAACQLPHAAISPLNTGRGSAGRFTSVVVVGGESLLGDSVNCSSTAISPSATSSCSRSLVLSSTVEISASFRVSSATLSYLDFALSVFTRRSFLSFDVLPVCPAPISSPIRVSLSAVKSSLVSQETFIIDAPLAWRLLTFTVSVEESPPVSGVSSCSIIRVLLSSIRISSLCFFIALEDSNAAIFCNEQCMSDL
ncbi:hypothetical protein OUZ56_029407 [Daphnia magna]|uniref:Uncharacterized protein n=1 Tax=Daphnia magna TaxID=35525 RepID=A0ABR0B6R1_9CRUS|nr:hypothetical protein OUZ56_029407 [Daphnia magna]